MEAYNSGDKLLVYIWNFIKLYKYPKYPFHYKNAPALYQVNYFYQFNSSEGVCIHIYGYYRGNESIGITSWGIFKKTGMINVWYQARKNEIV